MTRQDYNPYSFIESTHSSTNYGIIVLNYSLNSLRNLMTKKLWNEATIRGCADGGSNMLKIYSDETNEKLLPDYINGDFDSIDEQTVKYYQSQSTVNFIRTQDQNATDFTKCVRVMMDKHANLTNLLVFCSLSGRFDHTIGIIHSVYILNETYPNLQIYLFTDYDISFLLHAEKLNRISIQSRYRGDVCSLLPFGQNARVHTEGLKWNLTRQQELSFTKLVSSSNSYENEQTNYVDVFTDANIIWSMTYVCDRDK